jgi:hypothetical protein
MADTLKEGSCVACGYKPIRYVEGCAPLCVTGKLVARTNASRPHEWSSDIEFLRVQSNPRFWKIADALEAARPVGDDELVALIDDLVFAARNAEHQVHFGSRGSQKEADAELANIRARISKALSDGGVEG